MAMDLTVANTIRDQLGSALRMIGAKNLAGDANSLRFSIMRGAKDGINKIIIRLDPSDTYTVEFWKIGRAPAFKCDQISTHSDIYVDSLHDLIERVTGLATRMPRVVGFNA